MLELPSPHRLTRIQSLDVLLVQFDRRPREYAVFPISVHL